MQIIRNSNNICARVLHSYTLRVDTDVETGTSSSESYVPIRSAPTVPQKFKKLIESLRSYTIWTTLPAESPGQSGQPPGTQEMPSGAHKSKTITFHYVLHTFLYVPRQPSFLEGGFLGTFGARCFLLRSRALPCTSASSLLR